jgi:non-homologous end joining protein Ku
MKRAKAERSRLQRQKRPRTGQIIDLMKALKESIERAKPKQKAAATQRKRKTAS